LIVLVDVKKEEENSFLLPATRQSTKRKLAREDGSERCGIKLKGTPKDDEIHSFRRGRGYQKRAFSLSPWVLTGERVGTDVSHDREKQT